MTTDDDEYHERLNEVAFAIIAGAPPEPGKRELYVTSRISDLAEDELIDQADIEEVEDLARAHLGLRPRPSG